MELKDIIYSGEAEGIKRKEDLYCKIKIEIQANGSGDTVVSI